MASDLYEQDFYLWTQTQAEALRRRDGARNQLDYDLLAEEIENLGSEQKNAVRSYVTRIIQHLHKLSASARTEPRNHWMAEIRQFRMEADFRLTKTIRHAVEAELETLHAKGLKLAVDDLSLHERNVSADPTLRWSLPQILGEADDPLEGQSRPA